MASSLRRSGSALLLTLLMMVAVSAVVLVVSRNAIALRRAATQSDLSRQAVQAARSGIEEGLLRLKAGGVDSNGEYGVITSGANYDIGPQRRGSLPGSDCVSPAAPSAAYDEACPYGDVAIHRLEAVADSAPVNEVTVMNQWDLPPGQAVNVLVMANPSGFSLLLNLAFGSTVSCLGDCFGGVVASGPGPYVDQGRIIVPPGRIGAMSLQLTGSITRGKGINLERFSPGGKVVIRRPATVVHSTGYAGGVHKGMVAVLSPGATIPSVFDFVGSFSHNGVQQY